MRSPHSLKTNLRPFRMEGKTKGLPYLESGSPEEPSCCSPLTDSPGNMTQRQRHECSSMLHDIAIHFVVLEMKFSRSPMVLSRWSILIQICTN